jgi:hypothetical protein
MFIERQVHDLAVDADARVVDPGVEAPEDLDGVFGDRQDLGFVADVGHDGGDAAAL